MLSLPGSVAPLLTRCQGLAHASGVKVTQFFGVREADTLKIQCVNPNGRRVVT